MENQFRWVNNFWGPNDTGYTRLMQRMHHAKQTSEEIESYYREWTQIEHEYSKKLLALSRKSLGTHEGGGLRQSLDSVRSNTQLISKTHETVARQLNEQITSPATAFFSSLRDRRKTIEDTMAQLTKAKTHENSVCEKLRTKYETECNKISGYQAQQNLLMGRELEKNNQKLDKATVQVEIYQRQYQDALRSLAQSIEVWNSEWKINCDRLEQLENERIAFTKSNLWAFTNALSAACVTDDEACEAVRQALEKCDPSQDLETFSKSAGTGSAIQDPPEFINVLQGFSRDTQNKNNYHVAKFDSALDLKEESIPNLSVNSQNPRMSVSSEFSNRDSPNRSPVEVPYAAGGGGGGSPNRSSLGLNTTWQYSPDSQFSSPEMDEKPKKRSWAMPFKRQSSPDISFQSTNAPTTSGPTSSSTFQAAPNVNALRIQTGDDTNKLSNRKSWAPSSTSGTTSASSANGDPLLQALESLKAPTLKPRPQSTYASIDHSHNSGISNHNTANTSTGSISPYGNGSPVALSPSHSPVPKQRVQRKQVGGGQQQQQLPKTTTDGFPVIKYSRAQYDYRAAIPEEVSFRKGDLLLITEMQEDGWWDCEVFGKQEFGLAPSNFLVDA